MPLAISLPVQACAPPRARRPARPCRHGRPGCSVRVHGRRSRASSYDDASRRAPGCRTACDDPSLYLNRELSWLDFNDRVLQLAEDERAAAARARRSSARSTRPTSTSSTWCASPACTTRSTPGVENPGQDGRTPSETIALIRERVLELGRAADRLLRRTAAPRARRARHPRRRRRASSTRSGAPSSARHFQKAIFPALTPLAVAPGRPFPYISNLSLSLAVLVRDPVTEQTVFARVKVPTEILPRFVDAQAAPRRRRCCSCRSRT